MQQRWKRLAALAVAPICLVLGACQPISHTVLTVREAPLSPATLRLLSGDANFAVVDATAPSATVPGAGTWRVDRRDGSTIALPMAALRISADGQRVLLSNNTLWRSSGTYTAPAGAAFSDDLTAVAYRGTDGLIKTADTTTLVVRNVETGFPRPAGSTSVGAAAVSDDGDTVQYAIAGTGGTTVRIVDLADAAKVDLPDDTGTHNYGTYDVATTDTFRLAAGGGVVAHLHQEEAYGMGDSQLMDSTVDLVAIPSGTILNHYVNPVEDQQAIARLLVGAGGTSWLYRERSVYKGQPGCPAAPFSVFCVVASTTTTLGLNGEVKNFNSGAASLASFDISRDARFALVTKELIPYPNLGPKGPVQVFDWLASDSGVEVLGSGPTYTETDSLYCGALTGSTNAPCTAPGRSADGQMSDNGQLIATTSVRGGWYEYAH